MGRCLSRVKEMLGAVFLGTARAVNTFWRCGIGIRAICDRSLQATDDYSNIGSCFWGELDGHEPTTHSTAYNGALKHRYTVMHVSSNHVTKRV